jgi:hypothetical protein
VGSSGVIDISKYVLYFQDYEMDENEVYFSYAKNGDDLGVCFQVEKSQIEGQAMFPHILTKNTSFEVNLGAQVRTFRATLYQQYITSCHRYRSTPLKCVLPVKFFLFESCNQQSDLHVRCLPLLKIEISSNGQNCYILD